MRRLIRGFQSCPVGAAAPRPASGPRVEMLKGANLAVRFLLEVWTVTAVGYWGFRSGVGSVWVLCEFFVVWRHPPTHTKGAGRRHPVSDRALKGGRR